MLLAISLAAAACSHNAPSTTAPRGEPEVIFHGDLHVKVELARTPLERERGLMFRDKLEGGHGMLFLFEKPQKLSFWMKNTYIPLDMIFMDEQKRVVFVEENAEPHTLGPRGPSEDTQYVLEVPGGWARAHGVAPGVEARFLNVD
jgi:uncharacterized membrane protein (UPF0127 family)